MSCRLNGERVAAPGAHPDRWALVLHGVFGSGANWRLFMKRLAERVPAWGFLLADLRGHGSSGPASSPHDLPAAADDLVALREREQVEVDAVIGHSLGGKVALAYAARATPRQVWVIDSRLGTGQRDDDLTARVLTLLGELPARFDSRDAFTAQLVERGLSRPIAQWLAMSLRRNGEGLRLGLDLGVIEGLLESYFATDGWLELERAVPGRTTHYVLAGRSPVMAEADRARLRELATLRSDVVVHELPDSGHWVHVDAPEALTDLLATALAES